jgi:hypothetical protein
MRRLLGLGAAVLAALAVPGALEASSQAPGTGQQPTFATGTAKVVLDVVVRDKKGRPVLDVRADEIEVVEEGIRQTIEGFTRIETLPRRSRPARLPPGGRHASSAW